MDDIQSLKVILVGSSGVGKTSLISSYFEEKFDSNSKPTVAPAFSSTRIVAPNPAGGQDMEVQLEIWDTAGQEQYQSISKMFYRDSDVCVVCFDSDHMDSIGEWVEAVRSNVDGCHFIFTATKSDLLNDIEAEKCQKFGNEIAAQFGADAFFLSSSKSQQGVQEIFRLASTYVYQNGKFSTSSPLKETQVSGTSCC